MNISQFEPYISRFTMYFHFEKHYKGYINNLNKLIKEYKSKNKNVQLNQMTLEQIINDKSITNIKIHQNANQVINHRFFFEGLKKDVPMPVSVSQLIINKYGSVKNFKEQLKNTVLNHFSNGWVWICLFNNNITIIDTHDDDTMFKYNLYTPLFVIDIWEHAYYLDTQNDRSKYFENIWNCINWGRIETLIHQNNII